MSIFNSVSVNKPKKSKFNLSHQVIGSTDVGRLTPFLCRELVPGDRFHVSTQSFTRTMPLVAPIFHEMDVAIHYFFVPKRLLWSEWEEHITGGIDGTSAPEFPQFPLASLYAFLSTMPHDNPNYELLIGTLFDHLGLPIPQSNDELNAFIQLQENLNPSDGIWISILPIMAVLKVYEDWYQNRNLQQLTKLDKPLSGSELVSEFQTLISETFHGLGKRDQNFYVNLEKEYFTSALLTPQRGSDVFVPINFNQQDLRISQQTEDLAVAYQTLDGQIPSEPALMKLSAGANSNLIGVAEIGGQQKTLQYPPNYFEEILSIDGELTSGGLNIEDLRASARLQEWLELNARGGSRYIEQIYAHFGVISSDSRLQRSQFLGGGKSPLQISEVLQTSETNETPLGDMAGRAVSFNSSNSVNVFAEEHGFLLGFYFVKPRIIYKNQGLDRMWCKFDKFDEYFPKFAHLGEQEILNKELNVFPSIVFNGSTPDSGTEPNETFGYQERFAEYKFIPSRVVGDMSHSLDFWTLARQFNGAPVLGDDFISSRSIPWEQIFSVTESDNDKIIFHNRVRITAYRPMPYHAVPFL